VTDRHDIDKRTVDSNLTIELFPSSVDDFEATGQTVAIVHTETLGRVTDPRGRCTHTLALSAARRKLCPASTHVPWSEQ
jgi:hypothetical protein